MMHVLGGKRLWSLMGRAALGRQGVATKARIRATPC